ncbi:hypothetical protein RB195_018920 [Necator americanus]|uniref:J domain-containing protein n=1 Tax=Necator americanus TaxID=51031 RepID=A0ABR1CBT2_NECAM
MKDLIYLIIGETTVRKSLTVDDFVIIVTSEQSVSDSQVSCFGLHRRRISRIGVLFCESRRQASRLKRLILNTPEVARDMVGKLCQGFSCDILDARRMAHASVVDDPEKHFLGNLLEEDTSQNPLPLTAGSSPSLGTIPPVSVISGVGPISSTNSLLRSYWPEPPPPYSPPTQNPFRVPWCSSESKPFLSTTSSDFLFPGGQPTFITQQQIHHHHHNLHHHTHTHSLVESHHHYPITTITVPSHSYCPNFLTEDPLNIGNVILNDECRRFSSDSSMKYATQKMGEDELPLPSTTLLPNKLPLSYRDVAARNDQITGSDGSPLPQVKKLQSHPGSENSSNFLKVQENVDGESATIVKTKGSRKSKSDQPVEFQKITRKKVATKKDKASLRAFSSLHVVGQTATVDVPTKYEILQKLILKSSKGTLSTGDVLMSRREQENMRPTMMNGRPRSSSLFPDNNGGTLVDVPVRLKRTVDMTEKKKQILNTSNNMTQSQQRGRKRSERGWMDKTVIVIVFLFGWIELGFKWILNLVVDVCLQIYAVTFFSIIYLWGSVHSHIRRFFIMTSSAALYSIASIRQIDLRRLLRFREPEPLVWGLEENIVLPTTGEEALERFLYSPKCQDAYGVLGLQASCTEEDVRRHYKKLSTLLNPERNPLEGAEEAYEMVTKAYQVLSTPESRKAYNFYRIRPCKSDLHHEIGEMWDRVRERIKDSRSSMYCDCGHRHARIALDIPQCEARYCRRCKTRHPARATNRSGHQRYTPSIFTTPRRSDNFSKFHPPRAIART